MKYRNVVKYLNTPGFVSLLVLINGLLLVGDNLLIVLSRHSTAISKSTVTNYSLQINLLIGLLMIYFSTLLQRAKRNAWVSTLLIYIGTLFYSSYRLFYRHSSSHIAHHYPYRWFSILIQIILPVIIIGLLLIGFKKYSTKSDARSFQKASLISLIFIIVTFIYGVSGFTLLDSNSFYQEFSLGEAVHYTIDQLGITTSTNLIPHTQEGRIFLDSLNIASLATMLFVLLAYFAPIKARFITQEIEKTQFKHLLANDPKSNSEDFFKLWPEDKYYFMDEYGFSGLAYRVENGVALVLGSPNGDSAFFSKLIKSFSDLCYGNDWKLSFLHFEPDFKRILEKKGFEIQKIGEEAVVEIDKFISSTISDKYFRNIVNRFNTNGYTSEYFTPPHSKALNSRLKTISDEWLSRGRSERGFVMGYFTEEYINQCDIFVARDQAGTIQAFINIVPANWDKEEVTYDMLRYADTALGNVNDFILIELIKSIKEKGFSRLNLGLSPLANIEEEKEKGIVPKTMGLVYSNMDRMYSFSGLYRFKNKYEPNWRERYIAYKGGIRGFTKVMNALIKTMKKTAKPNGFKRSRLFRK